MWSLFSSNGLQMILFGSDESIADSSFYKFYGWQRINWSENNLCSFSRYLRLRPLSTDVSSNVWLELNLKETWRHARKNGLVLYVLPRTWQRSIIWPNSGTFPSRWSNNMCKICSTSVHPPKMWSSKYQQWTCTKKWRSKAKGIIPSIVMNLNRCCQLESEAASTVFFDFMLSLPPTVSLFQ